MLLPALLAALLAAPDSVPAGRPTAVPGAAVDAWATVLAFDEVRVEVDTLHLGGAGPVSAWVRWTFAARAVSPAAWDAGVRRTVDAVEVDCAGGSLRTLASAGYAADGRAVDGAAVEDAGAAWRRPSAESVGGRLAAAVCRLAGRA